MRTTTHAVPIARADSSIGASLQTKMLAQDEARRIAINVARLPEREGGSRLKSGRPLKPKEGPSLRCHLARRPV
jgi:hypothetical protein